MTILASADLENMAWNNGKSPPPGFEDEDRPNGPEDSDADEVRSYFKKRNYGVLECIFTAS
jgi:hypothetical protein